MMMGGMPPEGGAPMGPPPEGPAGLDPNVSPDVAAAAQSEMGNEELHEAVKNIESRVGDLEKSLDNVERILNNIAHHIGASTKSTGSGDNEEAEDAEKSSTASLDLGADDDEIAACRAVAAGMRKYASSLLEQAYDLK